MKLLAGLGKGILALLLVVGCVAGMAVADRRIRREGFGEEIPPFFTQTNTGFSVYVFGKTVAFPMGDQSIH